MLWEVEIVDNTGQLFDVEIDANTGDLVSNKAADHDDDDDDGDDDQDDEHGFCGGRMDQIAKPPG